MLHRIDVNVEISSRSVNCQLYQIREPTNDFRCRFQPNSAAKQTQPHCIYLLPYSKFLARKPTRSRVFPHLFSSLNVNTGVFYEFSMCKIFLPLMLSFLMEFI